MTHLTADELIDAVDAALSPARRAHLDTCDRCRREAIALHAALSEVRAADVPEPSPLFWDHFSARVTTAIAEAELPPARRWFHWHVLAPLAGLALLVMALVSSVPSRPGPGDTLTGVTAQATIEEAGADIEAEWTLLADLFSEYDVDSAREAGIVAGPGAADQAVLQLTLGEQQELMRLLREELRAGG
jgi:hypothetical protein